MSLKAGEESNRLRAAPRATRRGHTRDIVIVSAVWMKGRERLSFSTHASARSAVSRDCSNCFVQFCVVALSRGSDHWAPDAPMLKLAGNANPTTIGERDHIDFPGQAPVLVKAPPVAVDLAAGTRRRLSTGSSLRNAGRGTDRMGSGKSTAGTFKPCAEILMIH